MEKLTKTLSPQMSSSIKRNVTLYAQDATLALNYSPLSHNNLSFSGGPLVQLTFYSKNQHYTSDSLHRLVQ